MGEGEALKQQLVPALCCTKVRKTSQRRDDHELVDPIILHAPENFQMLLCKPGLHLKEFRELPKLIDLVFLDGVHSSPDIL